MTTEECAAMGEMMGGMMGQMMGGGMMGGGMMGGGWSGMLWFGLLALAVIVAVGLALAFLVVRRPTGPAAEDPRDILRRRFARGELTADEFGAAMKALG
jgi:putative membrane protein